MERIRLLGAVLLLSVAASACGGASPVASEVGADGQVQVRVPGPVAEPPSDPDQAGPSYGGGGAVVGG